MSKKTIKYYISRLKLLAKKSLLPLGINVSSARNLPDETLLGIRNEPIRTIIDIGANTGQFARKIHRIYPAAKIYSFEPIPSAFSKLRAWALSKSDRVVAINAAVGARTGQITMYLHEDHDASSSVLETTDLTDVIYPQTVLKREVLVEQITLDEFFSDTDLDDLVLIKMDVQGYEDRVLSGGVNVFSKAYACITEISLFQLYHGQAKFENLVTSISQLGFRYAGNIKQAYGEKGHCVFIDALFIRDDDILDNIER